MKKEYSIILLAIFWILVVFSRVRADSEAKGIPDTSLDLKGTPPLKNKGDSNGKTDGLGSVADPKIVAPIKDGKDQVNELEKGVKIDNLKEASKEKTKTSSEKGNIQGKDKDDGDKKKPEKGSDSKENTKEVEVSSLPVNKEGFHVEECDASNSCKVEKIGLVACLRVPGNESPELSLLIQNKGKGPLSVTITAPEFVQLEKTQIQLKENEDKKMKVTITKAGDKNVIVLAAGDAKCTLDYKDIVVGLNLNKETLSKTNPSNSNFFNRTRIVFFVFFGVLVVAASAWTCMSFRNRQLNRNNSKYQKMDMDLPVTGGAKVEFDTNEGWDNSWGDDWDDEEAPKTPSLPLTPSLSSKGLAPRRLNKEVWKD